MSISLTCGTAVPTWWADEFVATATGVHANALVFLWAEFQSGIHSAGLFFLPLLVFVWSLMRVQMFALEVLCAFVPHAECGVTPHGTPTLRTIKAFSCTTHLLSRTLNRPRSYFSTPDTFMKRERLWRVGFSCDAYRLEMSRKSSLWYFCANTVGALISSDPQKSFQRTVKAWKPARQDLNAVPSSPTRDGIFTRLGLKRTRTQSALFSSYQLPEYIHCFTALKSPQGIVMSLRYGFKFSYYCYYFAHCLLSG